MEIVAKPFLKWAEDYITADIKFADGNE